MFDKIESIYYGKDNVCRCGCKGSYAERDTKLFTSRINKLKKLDMSVVVVEKDSTYINYSLPNGKAFTVYFE